MFGRIFNKQNKSDENFFNIITENGKNVNLTMQSIFLTGDIYPFGSRLLVRHAFKVKSKKPVECIYSFMLPKDGTLRKFIIKHNSKTIESMLKTKEEAEEIYEEGIYKGHLSVLSKQYRDGIINLNIGNLKRDEPVIVILEILSGISSMDNTFRFRFPFTLAPSYHNKATHIETSNGIGEIILPEDIFDDIILPEYYKNASGLHKINFNLNIHFPENSKIYSPSHKIAVEKKNGFYLVFLDKKADIPNRDLMINIDCKFKKPKIWFGKDNKDKISFSGIIPGDEFNKNKKRKPTRILFILDKSASMDGEPLKRAEKALIKCIKKLNEDDLFGIITFATEPIILTPKLIEATKKNKANVIKMLKDDKTNGGTEILNALKEGIKLLEGEGDIFLITDGQVWESEKIINFDYKNVKIHCLGIGSASQDRFMSNLTYKTGGSYIFLSLNEEIEKKAIKLFNSIISPIVENIAIEIKGIKGKIEPKPAKTIYKYLKFSGYLEKVDKNVEFIISWNNNTKVFNFLKIAEKANGESLRLIRGSNLISLLENLIYLYNGDKYRKKLIELGKEYEISNSQMSLVSVIKRKGDKEGEMPETIVIPLGMPEGTKFDAYFKFEENVSYCPGFENYIENIPICLRRKSDDSEKIKLNKLEKRIKDCLYKIESYSIIKDDGSVEGDTIDEQGLKAFVLLLFFRTIKSYNFNVNFRKNIIKKLENFLKSINFYSLNPEYRKLKKDILKFISDDLLENLMDIIDNYIISKNKKLKDENILKLFADDYKNICFKAQ